MISVIWDFAFTVNMCLCYHKACSHTVIAIDHKNEYQSYFWDCDCNITMWIVLQKCYESIFSDIAFAIAIAVCERFLAAIGAQMFCACALTYVATSVIFNTRTEQCWWTRNQNLFRINPYRSRPRIDTTAAIRSWWSMHIKLVTHAYIIDTHT